MESSDLILSTIGLTKSFGKTKVLDDLSLSLKKGEIMALCGANGAGKSMLISLLSGAESITAGSFDFDGQQYREMNPQLAREIGIGTVYQNLSLIPDLSIAENIFFAEPKQLFFKNSLVRQARMLFEDLGLSVDVTQRICDVDRSVRQLTEILKAIVCKPKLLLLDEPTASLTPDQAKIFFKLLLTLKEQQVSILFVPHTPEEVFAVCDSVAVFRDGMLYNIIPIHDLTLKQLFILVNNQEQNLEYPEVKLPEDNVVLECSNLNSRQVHDVSFNLRKGEILGFAGLVGSGRSELMRAIYGVDKLSRGDLVLKNSPYVPANPRRALREGIGLVPEHRAVLGLFLTRNVRDNIVISALKKFKFLGFVRSGAEKNAASRYIAELKIKTANQERILRALSVGAHFKVALAKLLCADCDILILDEPTRGVDIAQRQEIYALLGKLVEKGKSIILVSSDFTELMGMSHRIYVMSQGYITAELTRSEFSLDKIMEKAAEKMS
ncbi:MAG: sugar ABC transporter ATP-binding protein [Succinivibrio sp.]|nr:sugar ABC transporter ATP-binding protein [Succinivibrio sp.]